MSEKKEKSYSGFISMANIRDIVTICLIAVITWKLINSEITFSIKEFDFNDLLSVFVAFFAIALSIAFYFKATETSNRFYDNSYKFTKEISEILGRIEAGFGEKLKHIDEGYSGIRDRFDKLPFDAVSASEEVEAEKEEIAKKKKEQGELLEDLAQRAQLAENEKEEIFMKMAKTNKELEIAKNDLQRMQRNIIEHKASSASPSLRRKVLNYLADRISEEIPVGNDEGISISLINEVFSNIKETFPHNVINDLVETGLMTSDGELSHKAARSIRFRLIRREED